MPLQRGDELKQIGGGLLFYMDHMIHHHHVVSCPNVLCHVSLLCILEASHVNEVYDIECDIIAFEL